MAKLVQISTAINCGSTGKIAEQIGVLANNIGWESYIYHSKRYSRKTSLIDISRGNVLDELIHYIGTLLFDKHGLYSNGLTKRLIRTLKEIQPNIIHLHNIHGYYLNYKLLFDYLSTVNIPIVWTLHDCWPITGHCCYFDFAGCSRWKTQCNAPCPCKKEYPQSIFKDSSSSNYLLKKDLFTSVTNMTIVPVSEWLGGVIEQSFLSRFPQRVIHNGIDLKAFSRNYNQQVLQKYGIDSTRYVLGVANDWEKRKGFDDFIRLSKQLNGDPRIVLVGLNKSQQKIALENGCIAIPRTNSISELASLYSAAEMFLNLTYEDNYPTTNLEAMACGTPVLTYNTGGSPESVDSSTGWIVEKGDLETVKEIILMRGNISEIMRLSCRSRAEKLFDKDKCFIEYMRLYNDIIHKDIN